MAQIHGPSPWVGNAWQEAQEAQALQAQANRLTASNDTAEHGKLREPFQLFVAGTFYRYLLDSLRKTVKEGPYGHGGRAEEVFRAQLDQTLSERLATSHGEAFAGRLFDQFARHVEARGGTSGSGG